MMSISWAEGELIIRAAARVLAQGVTYMGSCRDFLADVHLMTRQARRTGHPLAARPHVR